MILSHCGLMKDRYDIDKNLIAMSLRKKKKQIIHTKNLPAAKFEKDGRTLHGVRQCQPKIRNNAGQLRNRK